jgi:hypothetical protein
MPTYIYNLTEAKITNFLPKIDDVCKKFWLQIEPETRGENVTFPSQNTFSEDFCFTVKVTHLNSLDRKWPNSVVSSEKVSGGFICKVNVLKFLKITEENFKDYLEGKKRFHEVYNYVF